MMPPLSRPASVPAAAKWLTVSQFSAQIKNVLEKTFRAVWVVGEVSSRTLAASGHLYLDLKDRGATLRVVMWASNVQQLSALPEIGEEVIVRGTMNVYPTKGNYSLVVDQIHAKGAGAQDLALRRLKERLAKLGYFAAERKRNWSRYPRRIALLASKGGAAIRDILEILRARWPAAEVWVMDVRVQGPEAPESIAAGLALLNRFKGVDVVILGRGGGSGDDLSAFNDERVAHAIYRCKFPVISAIGHEIDVTIADLVADARALTPTDAANKVAPDRAKIIEDLQVRSLRMHDRMQSKLLAVKNRLLGLAQRRVLCLPLERLRDREHMLDGWSERVTRAMQKRVQLARKSMEVFAGQLDSLSPLNVLARGYSLTRTLPDQHVVRSVDQVGVGDSVEVILHDGRLTARVEDTQRASHETPTT
jgi:exodeoxyribonuclease VII large subunit